MRPGSRCETPLPGWTGEAAQNAKKSAGDLGKEAVLRATGLSIATVWSYAFVCWLKKHERDLYDRTACFALVNTYLLHEMGVDEFVTDYSSACESLMFDPMGKRWSPLMLDYLRLDESRLPRPVPSGTAVGRMRESLAASLGLPHGIALVTGGGDQQCARAGQRRAGGRRYLHWHGNGRQHPGRLFPVPV